MNGEVVEKILTEEEIRAQAPEGATHYEIEDGEIIWYAKDYMGRWGYVNEGEWGCWPTHSSDWDRLDVELKEI